MKFYSLIGLLVLASIPATVHSGKAKNNKAKNNNAESNSEIGLYFSPKGKKRLHPYNRNQNFSAVSVSPRTISSLKGLTAQEAITVLNAKGDFPIGKGAKQRLNFN